MAADFDRLTHYLLRYPAKFHPPVVRALLERYTTPGDVVLDPFCGSGTLLVEARTLGRTSIGVDVDPFAVAVTMAKVRRYQVPRLRDSLALVLDAMAKHRRKDSEYRLRMFEDLTERQYLGQVSPVRTYVPALPNLFHWFRRYVIVDLARLRRVIELARIPKTHKLLLRVIFASIIRNASNADPVPVSGLEVTAHMLRRDKNGRLIDPFALFERALNRAVDACAVFRATADPDVSAAALRHDATQLHPSVVARVDAVITSPPYHGAVDYYRRHKLEMFWLGLVKSHEERLELLTEYIGRPKVPRRHPFVGESKTVGDGLAARWEHRIRSVSEDRANAFRHYLVAMAKFFRALLPLPSGAPVVLVVGHSTWNSVRIPTTELFAEIAGDSFRLQEVLWYPVKNRYMSYSRHNEANIDKEYVVVFERSDRLARSARPAARRGAVVNRE